MVTYGEGKFCKNVSHRVMLHRRKGDGCPCNIVMQFLRFPKVLSPLLSLQLRPAALKLFLVRPAVSKSWDSTGLRCYGTIKDQSGLDRLFL